MDVLQGKKSTSFTRSRRLRAGGQDSTFERYKWMG